MVTRGEVVEFTVGSRLARAVVVSSDEYNPLSGSYPEGRAVLRDRTVDSGWLVQLGAKEPLAGGVVIIPLVLRIDPAAVVRSLGFLSDDAMNRVETELRDFLALP